MALVNQKIFPDKILCDGHHQFNQSVERLWQVGVGTD